MTLMRFEGNFILPQLYSFFLSLSILPLVLLPFRDLSRPYFLLPRNLC